MRGACETCLRRSWLLGELSPVLDYRQRDPNRLWSLLALTDDELIDALGGRRRARLREAHRRVDAAALAGVNAGQSTCRHRVDYPSSLCGHALAPWCLHVGGDPRALGRSLDAAVAILGAERATDYGIEVARALGRELAVAGVTVVVASGAGIASAVLAGVREARGRAVIAVPTGLDDRQSARVEGRWRRDGALPARVETLRRRFGTDCQVVSELAPDSPPRRWAAMARGRTLALMAQAVVVVEFEQDSRALAWVELARSLDRPIGAVPGRVTSRWASAPNLLIRDGAVLVRDAGDVLDAVHGTSGGRPHRRLVDVQPRLRRTLQAVEEGRDTLAKLIDGGAKRDETVVALAELELDGLLVRGQGGRYACAADAQPHLGGAGLRRAPADERKRPGDGAR